MDILWAVFLSRLFLSYIIFLSVWVNLGTDGKWKILRVLQVSVFSLTFVPTYFNQWIFKSNSHKVRRIENAIHLDK
jgi:hypothetical protein